MLSARADEHAALVFDDLASALDAGLALPEIGADAAAGDRAVHAAARARGVRLSPTEDLALEVGWRSGRAGETLRARAAHRRQRAQFARTLWSSAAYPLALLVALLGASLATMAFVGPYVFAVVLCVELLLAGLALFTAKALGAGRAGIERWPLVGGLVTDLRELPYLETLHALYSAGVPILQAHPQAVANVHMQDLRRRLQIADARLQQGEPLRDALAHAVALGPETRQLLATGEQAGQLEDALARAITRRRDVATRTLTRAGKRIGQMVYALAMVGAVTLIFLFYKSYFGRYAGLLR